MKKVAFVHDTPLTLLDSGRYVSQSLTYPVWERYLRVFDELLVITRVERNRRGKMGLSSGPRVSFKPVESYNSPPDLFKRLGTIRDDVRDGLESADGLIARLPSVLGSIACVEARRLGLPVLVELVGCAWDAYWHHSSRGKMMAPVAFLVTRRLVRSAPYVVYVTEKFLQSRYCCKGKNTNISNVDVLFDEQIVGSRVLRKPEFSEPLVVGSIGQIDVKYKGYDMAIRGMKALGTSIGLDWRYELVGDGDRERLTRLALDLDVADRVRFRGRLTAQEVAAWLDSIDLYVQPSLTEGLPRAAIEAMSRALPVVGSDAGGIPELLGVDSLFRKGDVESFVDVASSVLSGDCIDHARRNHARSRKYSRDRLEAERDRFLTDFRQNAAFIGHGDALKDHEDLANYESHPRIVDDYR